jgi:4-amino-4-deoxy-L-arabinose transferase-like glycosyltransferase
MQRGTFLGRLSLPGLIAAGLPVALVLILLVPVVDVDPVSGVTISNSPFTDEAWNVLNARNWALFGIPATDEWTLWVMTVPFTVLDALVFRVFGVGIVQARLVDIVCVAATSGLLAAGLTRPFGRAPALVAAIGYGTSALVLFYGRMVFLEPVDALFLTAGTLTLLQIDGRRPVRWGIAGGLAFALAAGTKVTVLPAILALIVVAVAGASRSAAVRHWVAGAIGVLLASALGWLVLIWLPAPTAVSNVLHRIYPHSPPITLGSLIRRAGGYLLDRDHALRLSIPLLAAGLGGFVVALRTFRGWSTGTRALVGGSVAGLVVGFATLALFVGSLSRYLVIFLPWLAILAAPLAAAIIERVRRRLSGAVRGQEAGAWLTAAALVIVLAGQGVIADRSWMASGTRELPTIQARVAQLLPRGSVVAGGYAPLLAMSAPVTTIVPCCGSNPINDGDLYTTARARYWASTSAPTWAPDHAAAWAARIELACLTWNRAEVKVCLTALP